MAQAMASGLGNLKPEPQANVSKVHGLALAWLLRAGLAWLLASRPNHNITNPNVCEPCQNLADLEEKIKEIRMVLIGLDKERQKLKKEANHNHDRLIHCLPPGIAAYIFELCIPENLMDLDFRQHVPRYTICAPLILSAVCTRWRTITHATPQLWKTLPLHLYASNSCIMPVSVVNKWINRAGKLPLSINLYVPPSYDSWTHGDTFMVTSGDSIMQIINTLDKNSNHWGNLKYKGPPSLLSYFSRNKQDLLQLQTLHLTNPGYPLVEKALIKLRPRRLKALSIAANMLVTVDFEWQHLTQLVLKYASLSEYFEALHRAPHLTRCTFRGQRGASQEYHRLPLPRNPILQHTLQYLEIVHIPVLYQNILEHLLCPSLKNLALDVICDFIEIPPIVEFLRISGCSLERLSLLHAALSESDVSSLCEGIPTLQHLHVAFPF